MKLAIIAVMAFSLTSWWRETNSHAASRRGAGAYQEEQYAKAADAFRTTQQLRETPLGAFNLGTAEIAAGRHAEGSAALSAALRDPELRADSYYNRGNAALEAKAFDHAIRDFTAALKARPEHKAAKRNLEIALNRRDSQRRAGGGGQQNQQTPQEQQPSPQENKPQPGQIDLEALLRSVQQQEQEELRRMKKSSGEARVGW